MRLTEKTTRQRFQARAKIVKAMAHATRLFLLSELAQERRCVCELTELVGDDISTVSKHLSVLKNAGLVSSEKCGNQVFYRLRAVCVDSFFECIESVLRGDGRNFPEKDCCCKRSG